MRETEKKRGEATDKPAGRDEFGKARDEEDSPEADDLAVPDYVMRDFGLTTEKEERDSGIRT